jgi:hypothetical protein
LKKRNGKWAWRIELSDTAVPFYRSSTMDGSAVHGSAVDGSPIDGQGVDLLNTLNNSRLDKLIPTTTTEPKNSEKAVEGPLMEVRYPEILKGGYLTGALKLIDACPPEQRQPVLDEIGAMHARGKVRSPLGLLKSLIEKAKSGKFSPNYSLSDDPSSSSNLRRPVHARQSSNNISTASKGPVPLSEIAPRLLADWREKWKLDAS